MFIAGGIGVTPFRSMISYMLDTFERRPIVLFYANKTVDEILYRDVFDRAQRDLRVEEVQDRRIHHGHADSGRDR